MTSGPGRPKKSGTHSFAAHRKRTPLANAVAALPPPPLFCLRSIFMKTLLTVSNIIDTLTKWLGKLAAALVLMMIAVIFYNVFGRYVLGASPIWLQELEWHLMAPVALLGISVLMMEKGHVRVDMIYEKLSFRNQQILDLVSMIIGVMVCLLFIRYSVGFVETSWSTLEGSPDPGGLPGRYILKAMLPVGFAVLALQCVSRAIRHAVALYDGDNTQNMAPSASEDASHG